MSSASSSAARFAASARSTPARPLSPPGLPPENTSIALSACAAASARGPSPCPRRRSKRLKTDHAAPASLRSAGTSSNEVRAPNSRRSTSSSGSSRAGVAPACSASVITRLSSGRRPQERASPAEVRFAKLSSPTASHASRSAPAPTPEWPSGGGAAAADAGETLDVWARRSMSESSYSLSPSGPTPPVTHPTATSSGSTGAGNPCCAHASTIAPIKPSRSPTS